MPRHLVYGGSPEKLNSERNKLVSWVRLPPPDKYNLIVDMETYNYKCTKCGSTYADQKKPLPYSNCVVVVDNNPNPVYCNGNLKRL